MSVSSRKKDDHNSTNGQSAHVKLRWMELDVEGGTVELVEGFRTFVATALTRNTPVTPPPRTVAAVKPASNATTAVMDSSVATEEKIDSVDEVIADESLSGASNGTEIDRPKRRRVPRAPKFLSDLDLTKASVQLADFVQEKNPDVDMDKYAVIAAWYKHHFNTEEITIDHIFTAYKALGWQARMPGDPGQTFRNLKSNKNWFDSGSKAGAYKINWNGENAVNKMGAVKP